MKQQEVFKKIGTILKELNDQYDYLDNTDNQLNDLELELFVANAHFLAEHSGVLRKLNMQHLPVPTIPMATGTEGPVKKQEERYFEPVVQPIKPVEEMEPEPEGPAEAKASHSIKEPPPHIDLAANGADDDFSYVRKEPEIIKHELILDESQNWEDEDDPGFEIGEPVVEQETQEVPPPKVSKPEPAKEIHPVETEKEVVPAANKKETVVTESKKENAAGEPLTINQMMSAQLTKSGSKISEHLHAQSVSDLKQAINLNDKLLYIKDLFNGYSLAYSEAIDILNRFSTFEEADDFLKTNYAVKNHWGTKQATVDKFYELLKRRYA